MDINLQPQVVASLGESRIYEHENDMTIKNEEYNRWRVWQVGINIY